MEPSGIKVPFPGDFHVLTQLADGTWFTQIDKKGDGLDTNEPEFRVTRIEPVGEPLQFFTDVLGYYGFFKYSKAAVRAIMPPGANAYAYAGEPTIVPGSGHEKQTCMMQPYRIEIDHTKRLVRGKTLANNYERMMELMKAA